MLTVQEADELLDYLEYISWLINPPEGIEWYDYLQLRKHEWNCRKF
jgi:hypothetical protein